MYEANLYNHRRIFVVCGDDVERLSNSAGNLLKDLCEVLLRFRKSLNILYAYHPFYDDAILRFNTISKFILPFESHLKFTSVSFKGSESVMGLTFDILILDLVNDLNPNDLGRLIGVVRGGGAILMLTPSLDSWPEKLGKLRLELATIQYPASKLRRIFVKRFIKKLHKYDGIFIYNSDKEVFVKGLKLLGLRGEYFSKKSLNKPSKTIFPQKIYGLALTQDQVNVLRLLERLAVRPKGRIAVVITADRGRGKSCSLGIGLVALGKVLSRRKSPVKILITAPSPSNIQSLMELALKAFKALHLKILDVLKRGGNIVRIESGKVILDYREPLDAVSRRADLIAVDEAAGIPIPMLHSIWRSFKRLVFSSTIHGYEGAGRGFSIRFLKALKDDPETKVLEYELKEPIRYAENDPVERWLFDALLLDAEPAHIEAEDLKYIESLNLNYVKPDLEKLFLEDEEELRQFIGIYILAHYRNQPKDLVMMADAPHHTVRMLKTPSGKVVCSVELAEEGPLPSSICEELLKGARIQGNIIPDRFIKHFRSSDFAKFKGWRIVRIATHVELMSRGIGSLMLTRICEEAAERGYDWVGAGFGVSERLLNFWLRNGFIPVHISPDRNPISGEYTVLVIKPLNERVARLISNANVEFRRRIICSLYSTYRDLEPEVAYAILTSSSTPIKMGISPDLSRIQRERLRIYVWGPMTLEGVVDGALELAKCYFYDDPNRRPKLSKKDELLLIVKILQGSTWKYTCDALNITPPEAMKMMRRIIGELLTHYCNISSQTL